MDGKNPSLKTKEVFETVRANEAVLFVSTWTLAGEAFNFYITRYLVTTLFFIDDSFSTTSILDS